MKRSSPKESVHTNTELKRYLGALHEEHMSALKAMGEHFVDVNRKLDSHTEMIGGLSVRMTSMEMTVALMHEDITVIKKDITLMQKDIALTQEDVAFIKSGIKRKVDQDEFDALIRRVSVLEKRSLK